jgi:hypothetical protein
MILWNGCSPDAPRGGAAGQDGARSQGVAGATGGSSAAGSAGVTPTAGTGGGADGPVDGASDFDAGDASEFPADATDAGRPDAARDGNGADAVGEAPPGPVAHRVLSSASDRGILAIFGPDGRIEWQYDALALGGEANDAWLLSNGDVAFAYKAGAQELTMAKTVVWNYAAPAGAEVHSCQPLPNGNFLIGEAHDNGVGYLRELDGTGKVRSTVMISVPGGVGAHGQFREVRKTPQGTYLVTYLQLDKAMEFDAMGQKLREFPCGMFVALRLPNGNTLVSCGDDHRVIEVDPHDEIVWQVTENEIPGNMLGFAAGLQRLANGDTVICNWPGHTGLAVPPPQAFEVTPDKKVVWQINNPALGWVSNVEILDQDGWVAGVALR